MNAKYRALLWEECRVGGVIAGACLLVGLLGLLFLWLDKDGVGWQWHMIESTVIGFTLGLPLLAAVLLTFQTGNSGHLAGGFSPRILLLPVEAWEAVGLTLLSRLALVLVLASAMVGLCHALFGEGPAVGAILVLAEFYLLVQLLDWLRKPAPLLSLLLLAGVAGLGLYALGEEAANWSWSRDGSGRAAFALPWLLPVAGAACYGASVLAVRAARSGERMHRPVSLRWPEAVPLPWWPDAKRFRSPLSAQLWCEFRTNILFIPLAALGFLVGFGVLAMAVALFSENAAESTLAEKISFGLEFLPLPAAFFGCLFGVTLGGPGLRNSARPNLFRYLHPLTSAEVVGARLLAGAAGVILTMLVAALVARGIFLFSYDALSWRLLSAALDAGETNLREILAYLLGAPLLFALAAWLYVGGGTRLYIRSFIALFAGEVLLLAPGDVRASAMVLVAIFVIACVAMPAQWAWRNRRQDAWSWTLFAKAMHLRFAALVLGLVLSCAVLAMLPAVSFDAGNAPVWFPFALAISVVTGSLAWAGYRHIMPMRHLVICLTAWAAAAVLFYLLGEGGFPGIDRAALLVGLGVGALVVMPYPALLIDVHRRRHSGDAAADRSQHKGRVAWSRPQTALTAAAVVMIGLLAWLFWPAEAAYRATLRAQGLPATLAELSEWYPAVPEEDNAALQYLGAARMDRQKRAEWGAAQQEPRSIQGAVLSPDSRHNILIQGRAELDRTGPIVAAVWEGTTDFYAQVDQAVATRLREIAAANLPGSRYPIVLGLGNYAGLDHLSPLRSLGRSLSLESLITAVEDRPAEAREALLSILPIAESLEREPILISQFVRIALYGIATSALETALNRTEFSAEDLERMQRAFSDLPPISEQAMIGRGLVGERAFSRSWMDMVEVDIPADIWPIFQPILRPFRRLSRFGWFQDRVLARGFAECIAQGTSGAEETTLLADEIIERSPYRCFLAAILMPALGRTYQSEWRCRVSMDIAAAACAVERFRIREGHLPESLEALVPAYLDTVPLDPFNAGNPVSYRIKEKGEFVIYSFAANRKDDGGEEAEEGKNWWFEGDLTFTVAPPEVRSRPQIAEAAQETLP